MLKNYDIIGAIMMTAITLGPLWAATGVAH
jgi:hypothetical protein